MKRLSQWWLVFAGVALLLLSGLLQSALRPMRPGAAVTREITDVPPMVTFTSVVLGGFRGLIADVLWLRATHLQDAGRYVELVQLADWITKLEPESTDVWAFHAWNMAYNVAAMMADPEDRWRWVRNGISLVRDEGIRFNASDPQIYWELAWLFQHKIGSPADTAHMHYKRRWADEMTDLLGGNAPDYAAIAADTNRLQRLRNDYKLRPEVMQDVDRIYGPVDWRLPSSHALYWAHCGLSVAGPAGHRSCERMVFQSMVDEFLAGRLIYDAASSNYLATVRPELLPNAMKSFEIVRALRGDESVGWAYGNFGRNAAIVLYGMNMKKEASALLQQMNRRAPADDLQMDIESFVSNAVHASTAAMTHRQAGNLVSGYFYHSYTWQALGEPERAAGCAGMARRHWDTFQGLRLAAGQTNDLLPVIDVLRADGLRKVRAALPPSYAATLPVPASTPQ